MIIIYAIGGLHENSMTQKRLNTTSWIEKAVLIHGEKFDYSLVVYTKAREKVKIVCKLHGLFEQRAEAHLAGRGCPKCSAGTPTTEQFINNARTVHGDKYDYSLVKYKGKDDKVTIICPQHGRFSQSPHNHVRNKQNCPKCSTTYLKDTDWFISKAKKKHGNTYCYSQADYKGSFSKVKIVCPKHGLFEQTANSHIQGKGCPKCVGKKLSNSEVIRDFISIHGNVYDYSKTEFSNLNQIIKIVCPEHGEFTQKAGNHRKGHGCPECAIKAKKLSNKEFIERAKGVHGTQYDYSHVNYINANSKVIIRCPKHGKFLQKASSHLKGFGCKKCSGFLVSNTEEFIDKSKEIHGNKYDYSLVDYVTAKSKVKIICPEHGVFEQEAHRHAAGKGCKKCSGFLVSNTEEFIDKSKEIHGNKYDYSLVDYVTAKSKVKIICPEHGVFEQEAFSHSSGASCPRCAVLTGNLMNKDPNTSTTIYYIKASNQKNSFYKIGVTTVSIQARFRTLKLDGYDYDIVDSLELPLHKALDIEEQILYEFSDFRANDLQLVNTRGESECFTIDVLGKNALKLKDWLV